MAAAPGIARPPEQRRLDFPDGVTSVGDDGARRRPPTPASQRLHLARLSRTAAPARSARWSCPERAQPSQSRLRNRWAERVSRRQPRHGRRRRVGAGRWNFARLPRRQVLRAVPRQRRRVQERIRRVGRRSIGRRHRVERMRAHRVSLWGLVNGFAPGQKEAVCRTVPGPGRKRPIPLMPPSEHASC